MALPEPVVEALLPEPPPPPAFAQDDSQQTESEQTVDLDDLLNPQVPSFRDSPPADPFAGLWVDAGPVTVPGGAGSAAPSPPAEFDVYTEHTEEPVPAPHSIARPLPLPDVSNGQGVPGVPDSAPASTRAVAVPEPMHELPGAPDTADVESDPSALEPLVVRPSAPRRRWRWVLLGVSGLLVCAQIIWYLLPSWIADPEKRWLPEKVCQFAGCTLEPLRDLSQLLLTNVVVRADPERPEVRQVDLLLVNSGTFAQAFPDIEITFRTPDGDRVAWKRFTPAQYLAGDMAGATAIPKKTPVRIALEVTDPGTLSYAYEITLK